jgi:glycine cleavage system aminomethyltransferase T
VNDDFRDILRELLRAGARFLVVGAHAMALHGVPRATGDLDLWIATDADNADRVWRALVAFGAPVGSLGVKRADLSSRGAVIQIGVPPRRIDVLTAVSGLEFGTAWARRVTLRVGNDEVPFVGRDDLIANKRAAERPKDRVDLEILEGRDG